MEGKVDAEEKRRHWRRLLPIIHVMHTAPSQVQSTPPTVVTERSAEKSCIRTYIQRSEHDLATPKGRGYSTPTPNGRT